MEFLFANICCYLVYLFYNKLIIKNYDHINKVLIK